MRTIWKFELITTDVQLVQMPAGATLLVVDKQEGSRFDITLWAWVETNAPLVNRRIAVVGTGGPTPAPEVATYIGTAMCPPFVWHVFDGGEA